MFLRNFPYQLLRIYCFSTGEEAEFIVALISALRDTIIYYGHC